MKSTSLTVSPYSSPILRPVPSKMQISSSCFRYILLSWTYSKNDSCWLFVRAAFFTVLFTITFFNGNKKGFLTIRFSSQAISKADLINDLYVWIVEYFFPSRDSSITNAFASTNFTWLTRSLLNVYGSTDTKIFL